MGMLMTLLLMCPSPIRSVVAITNGPLSSGPPAVRVSGQPLHLMACVISRRRMRRQRLFVRNPAAVFARKMSSAMDAPGVLGVALTVNSSGQALLSHLILFLPLPAMPQLSPQLSLPRLITLSTMWSVGRVLAVRMMSMTLLLMCPRPIRSAVAITNGPLSSGPPAVRVCGQPLHLATRVISRRRMKRQRLFVRDPVAVSSPTDYSEYYVVCGKGTGCPNDVNDAVADVSESHPVRCCHNERTPVFRTTRCEGVWAASTLGDSCHKQETYEEAETICAGSGGRLFPD